MPQEDEALRKETTCKKGLQENQAFETWLLSKDTTDIYRQNMSSPRLPRLSRVCSWVLVEKTNF